MIDYNNSFVMVGPAGVGKSVVSRELSKKTGLPVINFDILRGCPRTTEEIDSRITTIKNQIKMIDMEIDKDSNDAVRFSLIKKRESLQNEIWVNEERRKLRELMPNLPNYDDFGYSGDVSEFLRSKFGDVAWHYYQKQYEQLLLEGVCEHFNGPAILDLGGGLPISLDSEYDKLRETFLELSPELYYKHFNHLDKIGFDKVKSVIDRFDNVTYLKLPQDYSRHGTRASKDKLNQLFIASGNFETLATNIVPVDNLFVQDENNNPKLNIEGLESIVDNVIRGRVKRHE